MKHAAAGLLFLLGVLAPGLAQTGSPPAQEDPLLMQRRLAMVLRQSTKHYEAGEYQLALDRLDALQGAAGQDLSALNLRGAILTKLGRHDEARRLFNSILANSPDYFPAAFNLGEVEFIAGDYGRALDNFQRMRRRDPRNELVRFKILLCFVALDRGDEAQKIARGLTPAGSTPAWYYAQAVLARKSGDEASAEKHFSAARSIYPQSDCKLFDESLQTFKF